jgi:glyoxylase-like metal-dependent hydrolase (beta-lactamase superfamily II)
MKGEGPVEVRTFTAGGFGENGYLVSVPGGAAAVAIDPGAGVDGMVRALEGAGRDLAAVLLTHAHIDHIEGVAELVRRHPAPIYLHPDARGWYDRAGEQAVYFEMDFEAPPPPDHLLVPGSPLELAGVRFEVRHAPGHAPGHVVFYLPETGAAFVGDVDFQGSIGRSDLPGGDFYGLMRSIREEVMTLPDETVLYPGHGPATTVGHERISNPFLVPNLGAGLA